MFLADLKNHDPEFERLSHQTIPFIKFNSCRASYVLADNSFISKENAKEDQVTWKVMDDKSECFNNAFSIQTV